MCIFRTLFAGDTFSRLENYGENHHSQSIESTFVAKKHCSWPKCSVIVKFIKKKTRLPSTQSATPFLGSRRHWLDF